MTVPVRPWYTGTVAIKTVAAGALKVNSVQSLSVTERMDKIDTSGTGSAQITANGVTILQKTSIQAGTELAIRINAQYGAGSAGDPPQFGSAGGGTLYGNQPAILQAGDTLSDNGGGSVGFNMLIDSYENTFTKGESSPIEYNLEAHSNGAYGRVTAAS